MTTTATKEALKCEKQESTSFIRPCKNIRVTGGKVRPGSRPDHINIETFAHVEAKHA
jgi:hypothetical protein